MLTPITAVCLLELGNRILPASSALDKKDMSRRGVEGEQLRQVPLPLPTNSAELMPSEWRQFVERVCGKFDIRPDGTLPQLCYRTAEDGVLVTINSVEALWQVLSHWRQRKTPRIWVCGGDQILGQIDLDTSARSGSEEDMRTKKSREDSEGEQEFPHFQIINVNGEECRRSAEMSTAGIQTAVKPTTSNSGGGVVSSTPILSGGNASTTTPAVVAPGGTRLDKSAEAEAHGGRVM